LSSDSNLKNVVLRAINATSLLLASPMIGLCRLETLVRPGSQRLFLGCGQFCALLPGFIGMIVRRAFYQGTIKYCSSRCHIGFGVLICDRGAFLEDHVYVGNYALLGEAVLRRGCLIGSRSSILSQGEHHVMDDQGRWTTLARPKLFSTEVGEYAWIGEGAIIAAPVGRGAQVAAGTVVASKVPDYVMVAGNPARFVKKLYESLQESKGDPADEKSS